MKRAISSMLAAVMAVTLTACGNTDPVASGVSSGGDAPDGAVYEMRLANPNPVGDVKDLASIKFSELADEYSNGRIKITVYSGGTLGDSRETLEGLKLGTNEILCESIGILTYYSDLADFETVPYMYRDYDHYKKAFLQGELGQKVKESVGEATGFKLLGGMARGARMVTSQKKFTTPEELAAANLKMRVPNQQISIDTWKALGTSPTPLNLSETFTALQQKTVEAQENSIFESYGFGFYDVCDYLIETNHVYATDVFIFDRDYFNKLPEDIQDILERAAQEASDYRTQMTETKSEEYEQMFMDKGVEIVKVDISLFKDKLDGFVDEYYPQFADWYEEVQTY